MNVDIVDPPGHEFSVCRFVRRLTVHDDYWTFGGLLENLARIAKRCINLEEYRSPSSGHYSLPITCSPLVFAHRGLTLRRVKIFERPPLQDIFRTIALEVPRLTTRMLRDNFGIQDSRHPQTCGTMPQLVLPSLQTMIYDPSELHEESTVALGNADFPQLRHIILLDRKPYGGFGSLPNHLSLPSANVLRFEAPFRNTLSLGLILEKYPGPHTLRLCHNFIGPLSMEYSPI